MKTASRWLFLGVTVAGTICGHAPLRAQPAIDPAPDLDRPGPADDAPSPGEGEPAPAGSAPALIRSAPVSAGSASDPWNQGVTSESRQAARALFLEGNRLFRIPLFTKAGEKYAAALVRWKHPAFYFNLAVAQLNLGQEIEARENLARALAYGEAPLGAAQFQEARRQLREVELQLGRLRVTCPTAGAEVTLDGVKLFTGPGVYEGWAKAKAHEITAKKEGYLSEARRVTVAAGKTEAIELKLVTLSQATDASRRWAVWKPWAVVAAGGVIAAAGGELHRRAFLRFEAHDDRFQEQPCAQGTPPPGCPEVRQDPQLGLARREQAAAVTGYIAGGSLIVAGVLLLYLNRPRLREPGPARAPAASVSVAPSASEDMLGLLMNVNH